MCQETRLVHVRYVTKVEREAEVARPTPEARPRKKGQVVALAAISRSNFWRYEWSCLKNKRRSRFSWIVIGSFQHHEITRKKYLHLSNILHGQKI